LEALAPWHLAVILIGFVVLFGYKKLPDASRSLGRSLRIFKSEMQSMSAAEPSAPSDAAMVVGTRVVPSVVAQLEAEAAAAEARAAELRARAQMSSSRPDPAA
jgi:sec-independent protein translocase protein TatA